MRRHAACFAALTLTLAACGGGSDPEPVHTLHGVWTGLWGSGASAPSNGYQMVFLASGELRLRADSDFANTASGTWSEAAGVITATYTYDAGGEFSISATRAGGTITGTWGVGLDTSGGGTFTLTDSDAGAVGAWTGTYGFGTAATPNAYKFLVYPDGTLEAYDGAGFGGRAAGTWTLTGSAFSASYTYDAGGAFTIAATRTGDALAGTWTDDSNAGNVGGFSLARE